MTGLNNEQLTHLVARLHELCGAKFVSAGPPLALGLYRSVALVVCLMRKNVTQDFAGAVFGVSQSTVSRRWDLLRPLIGDALAEVVTQPTRGRRPRNSAGRRHGVPDLGLAPRAGPVLRQDRIPRHEPADCGPGNTSNAPDGVLLPFHLDTKKTNAACTHDISHDWLPQHQSWNSGAMDGFVTSRVPINATDAVMTMGYYTRATCPTTMPWRTRSRCATTTFFCPVIGPSDPNRLYSMAASLDPDGTHGGPLLQTLGIANRKSFYGKLWRAHHDAGATAGARNFMESVRDSGSEHPERRAFRQCPVVLQELPGHVV